MFIPYRDFIYLILQCPYRRDKSRFCWAGKAGFITPITRRDKSRLYDPLPSALRLSLFFNNFAPFLLRTP
jgi:hypothetical protein